MQGGGVIATDVRVTMMFIQSLSFMKFAISFEHLFEIPQNKKRH